MKHFLRLALLAAALAFPSAADAAARFLVACTTSCTWDNSSTAIWSTTSGGAPGSAAPTSADSVTLDANSCVGGLTCTITVNANLSIGTLVMGACTASTTGCILDFSANNNNITIAGTFSNSGTGTRSLLMGNGTWTMSQGGGSSPWDQGVTTNLTFNANSSTILFSATTVTGSRTFLGGGKTYSTVTLASPSSISTNFIFAITGVNTFGTLNIGAPNYVRFPAGTTTITNAFTWTGTAFDNTIMLDGGSGSAATISSANNGTIAWAAIAGLAFTGGGTFTATNSFNLKPTSGITITGPSGGRIIGG